MKKILLHTAPLLPLLLLLSVAQAKPAADAPEVAREKAHTTQIESYARSHPKGARYFADTNRDPYEGSSRWRELKAKKPGQDPADGAGYYTSATVWAQAGKVALVEVVVDAPSGDWSRGARYFFRSDGTLSRLSSTLSAYYVADATSDSRRLQVTRERFFDRAGRLLSENATSQDSKAGQMMKSATYDRRQAPVYAKVSKLPFYGLLRKSKG